MIDRRGQDRRRGRGATVLHHAQAAEHQLDQLRLTLDTGLLEDTLQVRSRRMHGDAQAHRDGFRIDRLTIDGNVTAFGFEKTVRGEEIYKVTGQIWQR